GFEILAGIGVFSALGFMAAYSGVPVSEVAESGVGLAFIAFPAIISAMPGGAWFGFLLFAAIVFVGFTSLFSIVEVVVASISDKAAIPRKTAVCIVGGIMAIVSILLFSTPPSLHLLSVTDNSINKFGIVGVALVTVLVF